ncbi:HEPN domain-containing protein [Parasulfuritortus cantonensis]|uniref:HEPN domain-containing protein n=1 Tax=Parasulfuritortus cantonensis TaxID=2528202 RepID=UPI003B82E2D7
MRIVRIEQTLERCEEHLSTSVAYGTEIESLLTQSILVIMCAEFEQKIETIVREKCSSIEDGSIREFLGSCVGAVFRSVKSNEIAGLLNRFGPSYKEAFNQKTADNPRAVTFYNNIVTNRHGVAHSEGSNATFREVKQFYEEGHVLLDYFREALLDRDCA